MWPGKVVRSSQAEERGCTGVSKTRRTATRAAARCWTLSARHAMTCADGSKSSCGKKVDRGLESRASAAAAGAAADAAAQAWVGDIPESVPEQVEAEDDHAQGQAGEEGRPPVSLQRILPVLLVKVGAPRWCGSRHADAQEADRCLRQDGDWQKDRRQDDH